MKRHETTRFDLPAAYSSLETLGERLRTALAHIDGMPEPNVTIYNIQLAVDEIFANIAGHAYEGRDGPLAHLDLYRLASMGVEDPGLLDP